MHHSHSSNLKLAVVLTESNIFKYQYFPDHQLKAVLADCDTGSLSQPTCWLVALKYCCLNILCKTLLLESAWMSFLCKTTMSYSRSTAGHTHTHIPIPLPTCNPTPVSSIYYIPHFRWQQPHSCWRGGSPMTTISTAYLLVCCIPIFGRFLVQNCGSSIPYNPHVLWLYIPVLLSVDSACLVRQSPCSMVKWQFFFLTNLIFEW